MGEFGIPEEVDGACLVRLLGAHSKMPAMRDQHLALALVRKFSVGDSGVILEAIDWDTGAPAFHFTVGSSRYNTVYSGLLMDGEGRLIHSTFHGIVRYERLPKR